MNFQAYGRSDFGRGRAANRDRYFVDPTRHFAILCGGSDHTCGGEVAADMAVHIVRDALREMRPLLHELYDQPLEGCYFEEIERLLRGAIARANETIYERGRRNPELAAMCSSLIALQIVGRHAFLTHVGGGHGFLARGSGTLRLTDGRTLSPAFPRVSDGEAHMLGVSSVLRRAVGQSPGIDVDFRVVELEHGDRLVLCSDGISDFCDVASVVGSVPNSAPFAAIAERLVELALERSDGHSVTALVIELRDEAAILVGSGRHRGGPYASDLI
ncbi:MAG: protein phosphatase 2C domain-containing protein [Myxococcales bacterium]|nr:protein phosphatase 2C domain-containing protein [Myxococcales bacterium]